MKLTKIALSLTALVVSSMSVAGTLSTSSMVDILAFDGNVLNPARLRFK